jgi:ABC-type dipeptide/oligopeptide/nickel transport system permease subunit
MPDEGSVAYRLPERALADERLAPSGPLGARWFADARRFVRRQPLGAFGVAVIALFIVLAIFADYVRTSDPMTQKGPDVLAAPSLDHWFGTNRQGQDVYSRVVYGLRPSLTVGISVVIIAIAGGAVLALLSGFFGGKTDMLISRLADIVSSFPAILLGLVVALSNAGGRLRDGVDGIPVAGGVLSWPLRQPDVGLLNVIIAVSIVFTPLIMRILRGGVLVEKNRTYIEAGRAIGCSESRLMFRHVLPNLTPLAIVVASTTLPAAIIIESSLSFLGAGLAVGKPSLGSDLAGQARSYFTIAWWMAVFPGLALGLLVMAFNFLGDSMRDMLDPRLRGTGLR